MIASVAHWSTQTVGAFWETVSWQGARGNKALSAGSNVAAQPLNWRSLSVRGFFSNIAWDGNGLFQPLQSGAETFQTLSYLRPIQAFFSSFSWEGCPNIGAVPQFTASPSKVTEISLDDLSDLF